VQDGGGTLQRAYDERGNILSEARAFPSATLRTAYTWDQANHLASIAYPSGWLVSYARDTMGRITSASATAAGAGAKPQTVLSGITYKPFGPSSGLLYGNSVKETEVYDLDYRLTSLTDSGTASVQNLAYGYDLANNVTAITDAITPGNSQAFGYDVRNELTSATGPYGALAYTYDAVGNRLTATAASVMSTYSYPSTNNRLTSITGLTSTQAIGYTPTGNINSITQPGAPSLGFSYNDAGRQAAVQRAGGQIAQYTYDAFGHRLIKASATGEMYQYDTGNHLIEETDAQGKSLVDYVYLDDRPVATISPSDAKLYFLHDDRLGTPQIATDVTQAIAWSAKYEPFGATTILIGSPMVQNLRLPGQEFDADTGFYHNGFRDYAPTWGRYFESDPLGLVSGAVTGKFASENPFKLGSSQVNLYNYAASSPADQIDPLGLSSTQGYVSISLTGTAGFGAAGFLFPAVFATGCSGFVVTSSGDVYFQVQGGGLVGVGIYAGAGVQLGGGVGSFGGSSCPLAGTTGTQFQTNAGFGNSAGFAIGPGTSIGGTAFGLLAQTGFGYGLMAGAGPVVTQNYYLFNVFNAF
jgi:RHS repeat-associated protein